MSYLKDHELLFAAMRISGLMLNLFKLANVLVEKFFIINGNI
jgi:hypothetical protein